MSSSGHIFNSGPLMLVKRFFDEKLTIAECSENFKNLIKDTSSGYKSLICEEDLLTILPELRLNIDQGKKEFESSPYRIKDILGRTCWVREFNHVIKDDNGNIILDGYIYDITSLMERQEELEKSKEQFRITLNSIGDGVIATDNHLNITGMNPVAEKLTGWSSREANGKHIDEVFRIVNSLNGEKAENPVEKVLTSGKIVGLANHTELHSLDGSIYQIADAGSPIINDRHEITGTVLIFRDVTIDYKNRREAENMLALLNAVIEQSFVPMSLVDLDGTIKMINKACLEFLGVPEQNLTGTNLDDLKRTWKYFDTDGKEIPVEDFTISRAMRGIASDGREMKLVTADGKVKYTLNDGTPIYDNEGKQVAAFVAFIDITAQKELKYTQDLLETAIAQSPSGILVASAPDVKIELANPAALGIRGGENKVLTGIDVSEHASNWQTFYPDGTPYSPEDLPLSKAVLKGITTYNEEVIIKDEAGNSNWVSANAAPVYDEQGNITAGVVLFQDITINKKAEQELLSSEERYKLLSSLTFEGIIIHSTGMVVDTNESFQKLSGYSREEIIGQNVIHKCVPEKFWNKIAKQITKPTAPPYEIELITKSGKIIPVEIEAKDYEVEEKNLRVAAIRDISARRKAEAEIKNLGERLQMAYTSAKVGVWEWDIQSNQLAWDAGMYELYGIDKKDFTNDYEAWKRSVHPDDIARSDNDVDLALRGIKEFDSEFRVITKEEDIRYIRGTARIVRNENGDPLKMTGLNIDITPLKIAQNALQAQMQFQKIIMGISSDYINIPIVKTGIAIQKALRDVSKYLKADRAFVYEYDFDKGMSVRVHEWNDEGAFCEELKKEYPIDIMSDIYLQHKKGRTLPIPDIENLKNEELKKLFRVFKILSTISVPLNDASGCKGFIVYDWIKEKHIVSENELALLEFFSKIVLNLKLRAEGEEELITAKEIAEKADRLKSEFLAQISHEIRTPLNVIQNYTTLLKDEFAERLGNDANFIFEALDRSKSRIIRTVEMVINFSELQTEGYVSIIKETHLCKDIMADIERELHYNATKKGLSLQFSDKSEDCTVSVDRYSVSQIMMNLVDNAIKYTNRGYVAVTIYKEQNNTFVEIKDTGIGMSEEFKRRLFEPFTQEYTGYTRKYDGAGLGLALVKKYCDLNGIKISVESEKDKGTKFTLEFS